MTLVGTPRRTDVVVVGGGVMGSATAWSLARRVVDVVLLEQFGPGHDLGASHGRARIHRSTYAEPHHQALVAEGWRLWGELEEETGRRVLHPGSGVATAAPAGQERLREVATAMQRAGVAHEWLTARPAGVYGLDSPGDGVEVGFHGAGAECTPDTRDRRPDPARLDLLQEYVRRWLPGLDPDSAEPVSCTCTSTPSGEFVLDRVGPVVVGAGSSGHGFTSAPAVGRVLADLALGRPGVPALAFAAVTS